MDQATQQNAALVEQMAASASSLRSQASDLVQVVAQFKLGSEKAIWPSPVHHVPHALAKPAATKRLVNKAAKPLQARSTPATPRGIAVPAN